MHLQRRLGILPLLLLGCGVAGLPAAGQSQSRPDRSRGPGVSVLLVDTDHRIGPIDVKVYGHFLEHINHSVVDGLYAEQIRGSGFEGSDFATYWRAFGDSGRVQVAQVPFERGEKSVRLVAGRPAAGIRQGRVYLQAGRRYDGSLWVRREAGTPRLALRVIGSDGRLMAERPLPVAGSAWQEARFAFTSVRTDTAASVEIAATRSGAVLIDFVSLMRADLRATDKLRPDLVQAIRQLAPPFIRWPGGSYASVYRWKDGIGPAVSRVYHPNVLWGGYSDYYGFGTEEFMQLAREVQTEPLVVLPATTTDPDSVQYAMDWVHYLNDPETTEWGRLRAKNGHPAPYGVHMFQIDNEPMNHGLTPEKYAEIVNLYGGQLRRIAPGATIVACGQKRSNDMAWSQKVIDLAGDNFDVLGVHNYEYESDLYETGVQRIEDYLVKLRDYVRGSKHPNLRLGVLEWNLSRTYDWRAGLHAAGMLMLYERLGPELTMACPALLLRNTTDDPTWTSFIYHDHVTWFPGGGYVVEKLFREHYGENYLASARGTFRDLPDRRPFFDDISQMKPEDWRPGTVDAVATSSADGRRIVIKAVNYEGGRNTLLVRLQGTRVPADAGATLYTVSGAPTDAASLAEPNRIAPVESTIAYGRDLSIELKPYSVVVLEITARGGR